MQKFGHSLTQIVRSVDSIKHVTKSSLKLGDYVLAMTHNSVCFSRRLKS